MHGLSSFKLSDPVTASVASVCPSRRISPPMFAMKWWCLWLCHVPLGQCATPRDLGCSFEVDLCSWSSSSNWRRQSGSTSSSDTGPDAAKQGDYYLYVEASNNYPDKAQEVGNSISSLERAERLVLSMFHFDAQNPEVLLLIQSFFFSGPGLAIWLWLSHARHHHGRTVS